MCLHLGGLSANFCKEMPVSIDLTGLMKSKDELKSDSFMAYILVWFDGHLFL